MISEKIVFSSATKNEGENAASDPSLAEGVSFVRLV